MIEIKKLSNGIPLLMEKVTDIQSFTMGIFVKTGARNEYPHEQGISHYIEHMMFKGTEKRSAKEISEIIDYNGGNMNAYTSRDTTCYYVKMLSSKLPVAVDVFADMFLNSTFTEENLEKERNVILEEIKMYQDIPEETIHDENISFLLKNEYGNNILGSEEILKNIDRDAFMNYFRSKYCPENIGISIAGNFDFQEVEKLLEDSFGKMEERGARREIASDFTLSTGENILKRDCNQVHLCFNTEGVSTRHEDRYVMGILADILGGNMSSRLFQKIREERGLVYSVYCYSTNFEEGGAFTIYAGTSKESYREVIELIQEELELIKKEGILLEELERAKNQIISSLTFALENSRGKMIRMWNSYQLYGRIIDVEEVMEIISKIDIEDVKRLAEKLFKKEGYSVSVLGDIE
ncbi:MAG: M16 family metallopeptidase [Fusobacteriaceae bacterium]